MKGAAKVEKWSLGKALQERHSEKDSEGQDSVYHRAAKEAGFEIVLRGNHYKDERGMRWAIEQMPLDDYCVSLEQRLAAQSASGARSLALEEAAQLAEGWDYPMLAADIRALDGGGAGKGQG